MVALASGNPRHFTRKFSSSPAPLLSNNTPLQICGAAATDQTARRPTAMRVEGSAAPNTIDRNRATGERHEKGQKTIVVLRLFHSLFLLWLPWAGASGSTRPTAAVGRALD